MNDDDSGDEAEARHLLEKRREQAKYDAVRGSMLWAFSVEMESSSPSWNFNVSAGPRLSSSKPTLSI